MRGRRATGRGAPSRLHDARVHAWRAVHAATGIACDRFQDKESVLCVGREKFVTHSPFIICRAPLYYRVVDTRQDGARAGARSARGPRPTQEAAASMAGGASPQHPWPVRRGRLISAACGGKATCTYLLTVDLFFRVLVPLLESFCHLLFFNSKKLNETKMSTGKLGMDSRTKIRELIFTPPPAMQKIVRSQKRE